MSGAELARDYLVATTASMGPSAFAVDSGWLSPDTTASTGPLDDGTFVVTVSHETVGRLARGAVFAERGCGFNTIAHELVHVYHGQRNPRPDFDGMDDLGWFVEGLAVYASGQLERAHRTAARDAIKAGKAPTRLADAWSGPFRYGVSGSMVAFVDKRYGRQTIRMLLAVTSNEEALKLLHTSEGEFIDAWKGYVAESP